MCSHCIRGFLEEINKRKWLKVTVESVSSLVLMLVYFDLNSNIPTEFIVTNTFNHVVRSLKMHCFENIVLSLPSHVALSALSLKPGRQLQL